MGIDGVVTIEEECARRHRGRPRRRVSNVTRRLSRIDLRAPATLCGSRLSVDRALRYSYQLYRILATECRLQARFPHETMKTLLKFCFFINGPAPCLRLPRR